MKKVLLPRFLFVSRYVASKVFGIAFFVVCTAASINAADRARSVVNQYGALVIDAEGHHVNHDQKALDTMARIKRPSQRGAAGPAGTRKPTTTPSPRPHPTPAPRPGPPPPSIGRPFCSTPFLAPTSGEATLSSAPFHLEEEHLK